MHSGHHARWALALCLASAAPVGAQVGAQVAEAENGFSDDDIVVTAQRREQSLLEVPLAITALSDAQLTDRGVSNSAQLAAVVPNLQVNSSFGSTQPNFTLRGIGVANEYNSNQASPVGVYINDVYIAPRSNHGMGLFDLERIEVLRGPGHAQIPTADFSGYRLHKVLDAILEAPEALHDIEALAAITGVSPSHFSRIFKQATGETPHRYVLKARIERAKELLQQSGNSVRQIAEATGFQTQAEFARAFRRETGEAATELRQRKVERNGRILQ